MQDLKFVLSPYVCMQAIPNPSPYGFFLYRGPKYVGSQVCTQSLCMYVGYTKSFSVRFFRTIKLLCMQVDQNIQNVNILIELAEDFFFLEICSPRMERYTLFLGETPPFPPPKKTAFFSRKSVARGWSVTPFLGGKCPLSSKKNKPASAAKPISACLYKNLTLMLYNLINHQTKKILGHLQPADGALHPFLG